MNRKYKIFQVDAFTKEKFRGNPAGVFPNGDGLTDDEMQQIARELNNSETAFLFTSDEPGVDVRIRYFTPTIEVPICGHATIAAHYIRAKLNHLDSQTVYQKTNIGILPVDIEKEEDDYLITMTQGTVEINPPLPQEDSALIIQALGLSAADLASDCPIQIVGTGHSKIMVGIKSREKLNDLSPNLSKLIGLSKKVNCTGYFVFVLNRAEEKICTHGRMFAPAIGINEDPVTGNANGPLGAYLVHHNLVPTTSDIYQYNGYQGEAIGRLGQVNVTVEIKNQQPVKIKVAGHAVSVFESEIHL